MPEEIIVTELSEHDLDELRDKKLVESQSWEKVLETLEAEIFEVEKTMTAKEKEYLTLAHEIKDLRLQKRRLEHEASKGRSCRRVVDKDYWRLHNEFRRRNQH